jgi:hypothetical protein
MGRELSEKEPLLPSDKNKEAVELKTEEILVAKKAEIKDAPVDNVSSLDKKIQRFLASLDLTEKMLTDKGIRLETLRLILNKSWSLAQLLRYLSLDSNLITKSALFPWLDARGIQHEEIPQVAGCGAALCEWIKNRGVWPSEFAIPFKSEAMLKRIYATSSFLSGMEAVSRPLLSWVFLIALGSDIDFYYRYPAQRENTTLGEIFFTQSANKQSIITNLINLNYWPLLVAISGAGFIWGMCKAIRDRQDAKQLDDETVTQLKNDLNKLAKTTWLWLLPFNSNQRLLNKLSRFFLWDNHLSNNHREELFVAFLSNAVYEKASKVTQWHGLKTLETLAGGIAPKDFSRLPHDSRVIHLLTQTQALKVLREKTSEYAPWDQYDAGGFRQILKTTPLYLAAHYHLWYQGQAQSRWPLQLLFLSFVATYKIYPLSRLAYVAYESVRQLIAYFQGKKACEAQENQWVETLNGYQCTACGEDNAVPYHAIFDPAACLEAYALESGNGAQMCELLNRKKDSWNNTATLDISNQQELTDQEIDCILNATQRYMPHLQILDFSATANSKRLSSSALQSLARFLNATLTLQVLSLINQKIDANGIQILGAVLAKLPKLRLDSNNLGDRGVELLCAYLMNSSKIIELGLSENNITANGARFIAALLPTLRRLEILDLPTNRINDEGVKQLAQALSPSRLRGLSLWDNPFSDAGLQWLAEILPATQLKILILRSKMISDVGAKSLAKAVGNSTLEEINIMGSFGAPTLIAFAELLHGKNPLNALSLFTTAAIPLAAAEYFFARVSLSATLKVLQLGGNIPPASMASLVPSAFSALRQLTLAIMEINLINAQNLARFINSSALEKISLWENNMPAAACVEIVAALAGKNISFLRIGQNPATGDQCATALADNLHKMRQLKKFYYDGNNLTSDGLTDVAGKLPGSSVEGLYIYNNSIGDPGIIALAKNLIIIPNEHRPWWVGALNPAEQRALINYAEKNTNLSSLNLAKNNFTAEGIKPLCDVEWATGVISTGNLDLSPHNCQSSSAPPRYSANSPYIRLFRYLGDAFSHLQDKLPALATAGQMSELARRYGARAAATITANLNLPAIDSAQPVNNATAIPVTHRAGETSSFAPEISAALLLLALTTLAYLFYKKCMQPARSVFFSAGPRNEVRNEASVTHIFHSAASLPRLG